MNQVLTLKFKQNINLIHIYTYVECVCVYLTSVDKFIETISVGPREKERNVTRTKTESSHSGTTVEIIDDYGNQ